MFHRLLGFLQIDATEAYLKSTSVALRLINDLMKSARLARAEEELVILTAYPPNIYRIEGLKAPEGLKATRFQRL
jgi:hypothetical protein